MNEKLKKIAIVAETEECLAKAKMLAEQLKLDLLPSIDQQYPFLLMVTPTHLELQKTASPVGPLMIDFLAGSLGFRLKQKGQRELLKKAIGLKQEKLNVIDATAGLGRDGFLMATLGCKVIMLERSEVIAALLQDGLERAMADPRYKNLDLTMYVTDANIYLENLTEENFPDVIYLDPMYPERSKSASVKKEMRYLQELLGEDKDADKLLTLALTKAKKRVVVKRAITALPLAGLKPDFSLPGKNTRFDIYIKHD